MDKIKRKKQFGILIAVAAATVLIAVIVAVIFSVSSDANEYDIHLEAAQKYLDELDYEQAVVELRMAIEIKPNNSEAYLALAETYVAMGDYENALAVLDEGYAATGDAELSAERERIAAELQEQERGRQIQEFYDKYADLYDPVTESLNRYLSYGLESISDRKLTVEEKEQIYGTLAEQLEQYLVDLNGLEDLQEGFNRSNYFVQVRNVRYFTKERAYYCLAYIYLRMGKLEECLRVRTEWATVFDKSYLVQDGHCESEDGLREYDKYGRITRFHNDDSDLQITYVYGELHDGMTNRVTTRQGELQEDDITYDSEGRILHWHCVHTYENEGVDVTDFDYAYTGNNSFIITTTHGNHSYQMEGFYDKYGFEIH